MEKWISLLIISLLLNFSSNQQNNTYGCSYESLMTNGKQITCMNVTTDFFQNSGIILNRSRWLTCKKCNLSSITNDTFNFPKNTINYLILIENNVMNISNLAFNKFLLLKVLNLKGNLIQDLNSKTFHGLKRLVQLDLSKNHILTLNESLFSDLENLDILNLNYNSISSLSLNGFMGLRNLKYLYLNYNNIEILKRNAFQYLINLKMLYLENNRLNEIHPLAFSKLQNLNYLYLNKNNISYLTQYNFKSLTSLLDLQLRFNNLTAIETSTFNGLRNLRYLYLGQNNLMHVRPYGFIGLNSLNVLDLIGNQFKYFSLNYLEDMKNLYSVWLENNNIENFTMQYHSNAQVYVRVLSLMENKLEFFNYKLLHTKLPFLEELWIGDNPWNCNFIIEIYDYFQNHNISVCTTTNCSSNAFEQYIHKICFEPFQNETEIATDFSINCTDFLRCTTLLLYIISLLFFYKYIYCFSTSF